MIQRKRWLLTPVITALALLGLAPAVAHAAPAPDVVTTAAADAYVSESAPTTAEGTADPTNCFVNDDPGTAKQCLMRFDVTGLTPGDTVTGIELHIVDKGNATGVKPVNVATVNSGTWDESTVTWATKPSLDFQVGSQSSHVFGQDSVFTLPAALIQTNGSYAYALYSDPNSYDLGMNFQPKENTVGKPPPRLVLHVDHVNQRNQVVIGANVHQVGSETFNQALTREDSASSYGPLSLRLYFPGLPSTNCSEPRNVAANSRPSTISFKDAPADIISGADDTVINNWLSCFARPTQVTYYHEMEDNFPAGTASAQWVNAWRHFSNLVDAHPNRANLSKTIIYGDFTWTAGSNRGLPGQTKDQFYLNWYPGDSYVDVFGADLYNFNENNANQSDNQTMAQHQAARPTYQAAVDHGKPYMIGEIGYDDPSTRVAEFQDWGTWLKDPSRNITQVQYFDGGNDTTPQPGNHRLLDQASIDAWRDVIHN